MRLMQASLIAALIATGFNAAAQAQQQPAQITVTGQGEVRAAPDVASLSLGVTTQADTATAALSQNNAAVAAVMQRLTAAGVDARDMQTTNLSLNPDWSNSGSDGARAAISGYTVSNQLTVTVRQLAELGKVLDAAVADGANTLNGLSFGLAQPKPALDEARKAAVKDAQDRAALLVESAGLKLGRVVSISEQQSYGGPMPMMRQAASMADGVPVAGGEVATTANVVIVYEIAP